MCNQLSARRLQLEHFIIQSGRTVPQWEQDQIIFGNKPHPFRLAEAKAEIWKE